MSESTSRTAPATLELANPNTHLRQGSLVIAGLALCGIFVPWALGMEMMRWGYGIAFLNLFFFLASLCAAIVFGAQEKEWRRIQKSKNLLAHWRFEAELWSRFLDLDEKRERQAKILLLRLIGGVMLFEGALFIFIFQDSGSQIVALVLGVLWLILAALATFGPGIRKARRKSAPSEVFIAKSGLVFAGELHSWSVNLNRLDSVSFIETDNPKYLEVTYSSPGRFTRLVNTVRIPVPPGREDEAQQVVEAFFQV